MDENTPEPNWQYRDDEYMALLHAVQSGVMAWMELDNNREGETSPKHLRVGVNSALVTNSALAKTLIDKGLITWEEFRDNEIELLKREVLSYEMRLSNHYGTQVTLS